MSAPVEMIRTENLALGPWLTRVRDPRSIFHSAWTVISTNVASNLVLMVSTLLFIRHVPKADWGLYQVLLSFYGLSPLLLAGFDQALLRFARTSSHAQRDELWFSIFWLKLTGNILVAAIVAIAIPQTAYWNGGRAGLLLPWMALSMVAGGWLSATSSLLMAANRYEAVRTATVAKALGTLAGVLAIMRLGRGIEAYAAWDAIVSIAAALGTWRLVSSSLADTAERLLFPLIRGEAGSVYRRVWERALRNYAMPINVTSALSYLRTYLPVLVLGAGASLTDAGVFAILRSIPTVLHKLLGSTVAGVLPRISEMYERERDRFIRRFKTYAVLAYLARVAIAVALMAASPLVFSLLKVAAHPAARLTFAILLADFALMEVINNANLTIQLSRDTRPMVLSTTVRAILEVALAAVVTLRFGMAGAAITQFVCRVGETVLNIRFANRTLPLGQQYVLLASTVAGFVMILFVYGRGLGGAF